MSAPPPPYQNQPPQQPYGYQQPPQQYGQQQYGQQPYGQQPQQPRGPQRPQPQRNPRRALINITVILAVICGTVWYVWDYNTNPNGGKAKAEASASARAKEIEKYNPEVGDCVKVDDPHGEDPTAVVVDCDSPQAQYKTGEELIGANETCPSKYDYGIHYIPSRGSQSTLCFTKL
ncbi:hypothetical protein FCH28_23555 [Streptomyces piniterrae]|uniref:Uncharacterized protein n=1 Tax=Streptomyces piniterrae TaxID=2571125 RepID=A0A4U0N9X8_9ACTN|nr:hypothetical protein [Streptomyces piniterrae]TJZ50272.1 hypothetical protein FCH28_23555 [Streptomyces piniterrae]